jgi:diadenosine tetraphosphate (Ap4A) HIT family hydrolase
MIDVQRAGNAIQKAVGAVRMNYAILGNAVPHVHCHIIPRFGENDPGPKTTPWSTKTKVWQMEKERYEKIIADIRSNLE